MTEIIDHDGDATPTRYPNSRYAVIRAHLHIADLTRGLAGLLGLVALLWIIDRSLPGASLLVDLSQTWLSRDWRLLTPEFLLAGTLLCACGIPRQSVALVGGYLFGAGLGTLLALICMLAGCLLTYHLARLAGAGTVRHHWPSLALRLDHWATDRVFIRTLMIRLFPVGSNLLTNIGAGVSGARPGPFLLASAIGFLPQTLIFALGGSSVDAGSPLALVVAGVLLSVSLVLGAWLWRADAKRRFQGS